MNIESATNFIIQKHAGQKRIGGEEYASHPIEVSRLIAEKGLSEEAIIAALFHDLLEDTDATEIEIIELSNQRVLDVVKVLTKYKGYKMDEYMANIKKDDIALHVKLADRIHNLRSADIATTQFKKKYIAETEAYYIELGEGTIFEKELNASLQELKKNICH